MAIPDAYLNTPLLAKIEKQKTAVPESLPACLFSDLDDSYILKYWPSEDILDRMSQKYTDTILSPDLKIYEPTLTLRTFLDEHHVPLIVVSGRDLYQMNELRKRFAEEMPEHPEIMEFDAIIGAVGTEIYVRKNGGYVRDEEYAVMLDKSDYHRDVLFPILSDLIPVIRKDFNPVAFDFSKRDKPGSRDELPKLSYKISYEFKSDPAAAAGIEQAIVATLRQKGYESFKVLVSCPYAIDNHINKYNVDIVPFSKDKPIKYLKERLGIRAIVAGDSGNDYDMIARAADCGIIVGNAKHELKEKINALSPEANQHIIRCPETLIGPEAILTSLKELCILRL